MNPYIAASYFYKVFIWTDTMIWYLNSTSNAGFLLLLEIEVNINWLRFLFSTYNARNSNTSLNVHVSKLNIFKQNIVDYMKKKKTEKKEEFKSQVKNKFHFHWKTIILYLNGMAKFFLQTCQRTRPLIKQFSSNVLCVHFSQFSQMLLGRLLRKKKLGILRLLPGILFSFACPEVLLFSMNLK